MSNNQSFKVSNGKAQLGSNASAKTTGFYGKITAYMKRWHASDKIQIHSGATHNGAPGFSIWFDASEIEIEADENGKNS